MKKQNTQIEEPFTGIPEWYWQCGLNLLEVNIIARISSWQRQKKDFFESYDLLSQKFNQHYNTIRNTFIRLEKKGVIKKNGKHRRTWKWVVDEYKLNALKHSNTRCQNNDTLLHQESELLTPDVSYKNTKTSNKTSFREEETLLESSSSKPKKTLTNIELEIFAQNLD